jgi:hypothetical protein
MSSEEDIVESEDIEFIDDSQEEPVHLLEDKAEFVPDGREDDTDEVDDSKDFIPS